MKIIATHRKKHQ